jgi:hypothetical protein
MRIMIGGDRFWRCRDLAADVLRRLVRRYGPDIIVAHSGGNGVDQSFSLAARGLGVTTDYRAVDFSHAGGFALLFGRLSPPPRGPLTSAAQTGESDRFAGPNGQITPDSQTRSLPC